MTGFIIAWVISPIILLPLFISAANKKKKLEKFLDELLRDKRITLDEYNSKTVHATRVQPHPQYGQPQNAPQAQPIQPRAPQIVRSGSPEFIGPMPRPVQTVQPQAVQVEQTATAVQKPAPQLVRPGSPEFIGPLPRPVQTVQPQYRQPMPAPAPVRKPKREHNPASVLLVIGSALVVLSGMLLSNAQWLYMNDWQRTGVIALAAAFFFGVSLFAGKKLKLQNTTMAFYMLGSVFASITLVTMGYFGLFGNFLSVSGRGYWLLYSLAALMVTLFSAGAVKLFKKGAFVHAALYGGLCSFTLMTVQLFSGSTDMWAMFLNIIAVIPIYLLYKQKLKFGEMFDDPLRIFTIVLASIYAVSALPFMAMHIGGEWTLPCFITLLIWAVQAVFYGNALGNKFLRSAHPVLMLFLAAEFALSASGRFAPYKLVIYGAAILVIGTAYRYAKPLRTVFSDIIFPAALFFGMVGTFYYLENNSGQWAICAAILTALLAMQSLSRTKTDITRGFTVLLPLSVLTVSFGSTVYFGRTLHLGGAGCASVFALVTFAAALLFTHATPLRTVFSDTIFPIVLFICTLLAVGEHGTEGLGLALSVSYMLTAITALHAFEDPEKRFVRHFAYILPLTLPITAGCAAALAEHTFVMNSCESALTFSAVTAAAAIAMRFIPRIRTRLSDWLNIVVIGCSSFAAFIGADGAYGYALAAASLVLLTIVIVLECFDKDTLRNTRSFAYVLPLAVIALFWNGASAISSAVKFGGAKEEMLFELIFMLTCFGTAFLFMHVKKIRTAVSAAAFPIALLCSGLHLCDIKTPGAGLLGCAAFLLMAVLMLIQNSEEGLIFDAVRCFLAVPFLSLAFGISLTADLALEKEYTGILFFGILIVIFGVLFRYSTHTSLKIRTLLSDILFVGAACIVSWIAFDEKPAVGLIHAVLTSAFVFTYVIEMRPAHRSFLFLSRRLFACTVTFVIICAGSTIADMGHSFKAECIHSVVMIVMFLLTAICFAKIRKLRTRFSDFFLPTVNTIFCIAMYSESYKTPAYIIAGIGWTVLCGILLMYGLENDGEKYLAVHRIYAPVTLFPGVFAFREALDLSRGTLSWASMQFSFTIGTAVALTAAALFTHFAKKTSRPEFAQSQYAWALFSAVMIFPAAARASHSTAAHILGYITIALCAAHYILCARQKNNIIAGLSVIGLYFAASNTAMQLRSATALGTADARFIMVCAAFVILGTLSRTLHSQQFHAKGKLDFAAAGMFFAPLITLLGDSGDISKKWHAFTYVLMLGVIFLNLIRSGHKRRTNLIMMTLAAAAGCSLVYVRPFLTISDPTLAAKINLIPLILFSIIVRKIWQENKKFASDLSFAAQLTALIMLIIDALLNQSLGNTLIVLCVTLAIMLISFAAKSGRWFAISSAAFLGLTIYITRGFVGRVEWWVYLLGAGLLLIVIAAANEYLKSRGESPKSALEHFKSRWKK